MKTSIYHLLLIIGLQFAVVSDGLAFNTDSRQKVSSSEANRHVKSNYKSHYKVQTRSPYKVQYNVNRYSQNRSTQLRSRNEVMQQVKRRYNAEVLKVSLDKEELVYRVRALMPNGKVRNLKISARR